jgi:pyruvate formate lyase activating enzyme
MIFDIQRFSTHDGAGIRTIVFFKGCPLRCPWCENPESQSRTPELAYDVRTCLGCWDCHRAARDGEIMLAEQGISIAREKVSDASIFTGVCSSGALSVIGRESSIEGIVAEIVKDLPFYHSSEGGVTLSGGEPYAQPALLRALLAALDAIGLKVVVETCLQAQWAVIEESLPFVQEIFADIKHVDSEKLRSVVGADFSLIVENFRQLASRGAAVVARVPVIPGFNDSRAEMTAIVDFASALGNIREIHFLPYNALGAGKYRLLGRGYDFTAPAVRDEDLNLYQAIALGRGMSAVIGG